MVEKPIYPMILVATFHPSEYYDNQYGKLILTLAVIVGISVVFTIVEVGACDLLHQGHACLSY